MSSVCTTSSSVMYEEFRYHSMLTNHLVMVDGDLVSNRSDFQDGYNARCMVNGYWGMASSVFNKNKSSLSQTALRNASQLSRLGKKVRKSFEGQAYLGEHLYQGLPVWGNKEKIQFLQEVNQYSQMAFPQIKSITLRLLEEQHRKNSKNVFGSDYSLDITRSALYVAFTVEDKKGKLYQLTDIFSGTGFIADLKLTLDSIKPALENLYHHSLNKLSCVPAEKGLQKVVIAPEVAGILAHESMGHPCEADLVLAGAATANFQNKKVASELITMVDAAHTFPYDYSSHHDSKNNPVDLSIPVYVDDEGVVGKNAVLIENGILKEFMHNRDSALKMNTSPTGNARAYQYQHEPLIRMRNTLIMPGDSTTEELIAGVENGYYLMSSGNGQADSTTEFMFGITFGYEINDGKLGKAIQDTSISGNAINMLQSVDGVSKDMFISSSGYCGKGQLMVVSMGGPAIRGEVHLGG